MGMGLSATTTGIAEMGLSPGPRNSLNHPYQILRKKYKLLLMKSQLQRNQVMGVKAIDSSGDNEYETPQEVFEHWNAIFQFHLDVCASHANAKIASYLDKEQNCFTTPWQ